MSNGFGEIPLIPVSATIDPTTPVVVTGSVAVTNFPAVQPVSGTVTADAGTGTFNVAAATLPLPAGASTSALQSAVQSSPGVSAATAVTVQGSASGVPIPVSGTFTATNPSVSPTGATPPASATFVGGSVTAAAPSYTSGQLDALSLTPAGGLRVDGSGVTQPVSGTVAVSNFPGTQPVSGTVVVTQAAASALNAQVQGPAASGAAKSGNPVQAGGVFNTTQPTVTSGQVVELQSTARGAAIVATGVDELNVTNISGTVSLPTGAATAALQTAGNADLATIVTNTTGVVVAQGSTTAGQLGQLVQGAVGASSPTYTSGQTSPLSLTPVGSLRVTNAPCDGEKATYSAAVTAVAVAATPTDVFTITGSGTRTVRVTRISATATQTTAGTVNMRIIKRSTANTGGTSAVATAVPHDSISAAATATVRSYTVNPTLGTAVGDVRVEKVFVPALTTVVQRREETQFGFGPEQSIVLRGTAEVLSINLNAVTITGNNFNFYVEWTEE